MTSRSPSTVLVAHDFSPAAGAAADLALDDLLDSKRGGRLVVVHVYTVPIPVAPIDGGTLVTGFQALEEAAMAEAHERLANVAASLRARVVEAGAYVAIEVAARMGTPADSILREAEERKADRIVIGTHGRTGVKHLLLGSVAERVVRLAHVPVLVAHSRDGKSQDALTKEEAR
jgi:nucleotide-binding universal stress UspA family protein